MIEDCFQPTKLKAKTKPDIIKPIIEERIGAYVTGSFIIGGANIVSDIDIVIPIDNAICDSVLEQLSKRYCGSMEYSLYNNGRKLIMPGLTTINILQLHPLDYAAFMFATKTMLCAPVIEDRNARHRCFEELCHAYKSFINPKCVTIDEMHKVIDRNLDAVYMANKIDWEDFYAR